jgi:hypothetical protein
MITLSWLIERLLTKPVEGSLTDVVITADWRCNGTETTGSGDTEQTYSGTCYGSCSFAAPSGSFTPYAELTEQQVLGWCYTNGVDQSAIEANVSLQIQNQIDPPVVSLPLPWIEVVPPLVEQRIPTLQPHQIVDPLNLPTSDVPPSVDGMSTNILG